jgi:hypothetical protein
MTATDDSISTTMSSKRKWDQAGAEDDPITAAAKAIKAEDGKSASEAAAAAAAIAAKIAAQFADSPSGAMFSSAYPKDPHDGAFTHDIDINDQRNRYLLTRSSTQETISAETASVVTTKGTWVPDRSKATERDPPLYLHISANSQQSLDAAIAKIEELISMDMGSLVEDKSANKRERVSAFYVTA